MSELIERLRKKAQATADFNKSHGRKGPEWAVELEIEWQAADTLTSQAARIAELEAQAVLKDARIAEMQEHNSRMAAEWAGLVQRAESAEARGSKERQWCLSCGTVTRDGTCDCTRADQPELQRLVNYADALHSEVTTADARLAKAVEALRAQEELYQIGLLEAPAGLYDRVQALRTAVLSELKVE